ncbi:tRNA (guanine(46)-N(7))-methyltransferase TrmB [Pseudogemmobacter faecipullorum]|uniref:tRNA (guanine-N(7)-)-methyltransferase n=1 Tax=Pseudogemmobacter faecipullorum TaxID=2755041 RepID=A0ABS8CRZ3_9RHOB|nr:tRNA (guanine(46)-N(7))-methyltransferase TrmB [Pseudogemmobacter faecipullorum]MCB5411943.1 tRNA (guanosine(46)-N7)-methyltransferase TrmB [Pseudogemmobacter faecipullorum]
MSDAETPKSEVRDAGEAAERRNFYGRHKGKTLRSSQKDYLANDLELLRLKNVTAEENPERQILDMTQFAGKPVWLEIGFGGGEHLVHMAAANPQIHLIGCEPFVNGVAMLLGKIRAAGVSNLSIHPGDVRDLFDVLPDHVIEKAFLNYPDPWPKARHHRRRFVTQGYLTALHRVMRPGSEFRIATDIPDYVRQAHEEVPVAGFRLVKEAGEGQHWQDWISTRYEQKAFREGRLPHYLTWARD